MSQAQTQRPDDSENVFLTQLGGEPETEMKKEKPEGKSEVKPEDTRVKGEMKPEEERR